MEIRLAVKKDFDKFLPIKEEFFREYCVSKKTKKFILKEFGDFLGEGVIVAEENSKIIGYLLGEVEDNSYEKFGYISEIFVVKTFRGKGIATKLKDRFLDVLRKNKINLCRIEVNPENTARDSYKKWGFKIDKLRMSLKF